MMGPTRPGGVFVRGGDAVRDVKSGWKVAEAFPATGSAVADANGAVLVALTGWGEEEDRRKSTAAGFDHHLVKPVDHDVLTQLIAGIVSPDG